MRKYKSYLAIGIAAISLLLSGCGTQVYELTADEEELIVKYAAYFVAKHNVYQKDGVSNVYLDEADYVEEDIESENTESTETGGETTPSVDKTIESAVKNAIGLGDAVAITYTGSSVEEYIQEGLGYIANPNIVGNVFYVLKFEVKNVSEQDVELNNLTSGMVYKLDTEVAVSHRQTYLSNDFSSYIGTIPAGKTVEMVLVFEVSPTNTEKLAEPALKITK